MTDTPTHLFIARYDGGGLSPRYEVVPEGAMGAEPWVPEGAGYRDGWAFAFRQWAATGSVPNPDYRPVEEISEGVLVDVDPESLSRAALELTTEPEPTSFQSRVEPWMDACFGPEISADKLERGDRLLEEVFELLQSGDYPADRVASLTKYVWSRPKGEPAQEVGGVMVTLAAYCLAHGLDMHEAAETELARIWTKVEKIRAKQAAKPKGSALPQEWPSPEPTSGAYDLICCTAEDVATGRGFTGDAEADLAMAQESLRDCLKLLTWRG